MESLGDGRGVDLAGCKGRCLLVSMEEWELDREKGWGDARVAYSEGDPAGRPTLLSSLQGVRLSSSIGEVAS